MMAMVIPTVLQLSMLELHSCRSGAAPVRSPNFISARYQVTPEDAGLAEMVPSDEVQSSHIFNLRAIARVRPPFAAEEIGCTACPLENTLEVVSQDGSSLHFNKFDKVHGFPDGASNTQADIFSDVQDIVLSTLEGLSGCVMVFGQTGSGKTYTLAGNLESSSTEEGLLSRSITHLAQGISKTSDGSQFKVYVSVVDTSTDSMTEHLRHGPSSPSLAVQQGEELRAIVLGALKVPTEEELVDLTEPGLARRIMASISMKPGSRRCHALINLTVQRHLPGDTVMCGKLTILEVEGSEQENMDVALAVPWLLQGVLGVENRMALIVCCSPAASDAEETISSLMYGTCAKAILWVKQAPAGSAADIENQQSAAAIQRIMQSFQASTKSIEESAKMREETARMKEEAAKLHEEAAKLGEERARLQEEGASSEEIASFQARVAATLQAIEDIGRTHHLGNLDGQPQGASGGSELQSRKRKASTLDGADAAARPQADARAARPWELDLTGFPALVIGGISLVVYIWMYQGE